MYGDNLKAAPSLSDRFFTLEIQVLPRLGNNLVTQEGAKLCQQGGSQLWGAACTGWLSPNFLLNLGSL